MGTLLSRATPGSHIMLARLVLAVSTTELRSRLRTLAEGPDTVVSDLNSKDWLQHIGRIDCDLVVVDSDSLAIPVNDVVLALKQTATTPELLMVSSHADAEERAELLTAGCLAVLPSELPDAPFRAVLATLIERRRDAVQLQHEPDHTFGDFLSSSPSMLKFLQIARKLSRSNSTAMILGETGVGKERLARAIHAQSPRADAPFIVINCGAVPEALMETELFGHERGAFTGAFRARRGLFELAHRGTVFLDEIGEMPLHLQVKLLRVIQERSIQRIGSEDLLPIDVRILAATNRDLLLEMAEQRFRSDLFYRLSVITLVVPPLRERIEDVELLANTYFEQFRSQMPTAAKSLSAAAMRTLQAYSWPGNIRELINVIERSVLLAEGVEITPEDFPEPVTAAAQPAAPAAVVRQFDESLAGLDDSWLKRPLAESRHAWNMAHEREYLTRMLQETKGQISATAKRAGIDPRSLYAKMKAQGLRKEEFR
ncbi:MAG: two-component system response regulator AtoC [Planctomycetota bacterium]|jgi:two-component system response regulator AtoC